MSTFIPRRSKKPSKALGKAFAELRLKRTRNGFRNENLIIRDLQSVPHAETPVWFGGIQRATKEQDLYEATDFFVTLFLEPAPEGHRLTEIKIPVNAKSSEYMANKLANGRHNKAREKHRKVPIMGFVVDPSISRKERRGEFFQKFANDPTLQKWLASRGYAFAESHEPRQEAAAKKAAQRKKLLAKETEAAKQRLISRIIDGSRRSLNAVMSRGFVTNRRSLHRRVAGLVRGAVNSALDPTIREAVASGVRALRDNPEIKEVTKDLGAKLESAIREARIGVRGVNLNLTAPEAEQEIAKIFGKAFKVFCSLNLKLGSERIKNRFLKAAKESVPVWINRAERALSDNREISPECTKIPKEPQHSPPAT